MTTVFCIPGMPRSGTSLIAHAVKLGGVYLGPDAAMKPSVPNMNDDGIFELEALFSLHLSILETAGHGGWHCSEPLPDQWWKSAAIAPGREALARLVEQEFSGVPAWGWKSPPGTLLLPLWEDLARDQGFSLRLIIPFRNPLDVARSLARVWNLPIAQGLRLWTYYTLTMLDAAKRHPHLFVQYDDFLENPEAGARRLGEFLGCGDAGFPQKVREIVRPGLRHSRSSLAQLAAVADADIIALYQDCLARLGDAGTPAGTSSRRLLGSLADYRQWSRLADPRRSDIPPVCLDCVLAFDVGDGQEHIVYKMIPYAPGNAFDEVFRLPQPGIHAVSFCPYPGSGRYFFRCRIEEVETDGNCRGIESKNPEKEENGWDVFAPGCQSHYKLAGDFSKATYVRIKGRIEVAIPVPSQSFS